MKALYRSLRGFIRDDWSWPVYLLTFAGIGGMLAFNYSSDFILGHTFSNRDLPSRLFWFIAVTTTPYLMVLALQQGFGQLKGELRRPGLWLLLLFGVLMVCVTMWFPWHVDWAKALFPANMVRWGVMQFWHAKRVFLILLPLLIYACWHRKAEPGLMGLHGGHFRAAPYFLILAMVLPLILWASFRPSYLEVYPYYKPGAGEAGAAIPMAWRLGIAELTYGLDFFSVEWLYRGLFVIGMTKWLGPRAVLPMAALYCSIHFGKPLGEAIASFFGGYALGVFAYQSRSIWGGVIVHLGVAWSMDAMALLQRYVFQA